MVTVSEILGTVGDAITGFIETIADGFAAVTKIFYLPGASGQPGTWTFMGTLMLMGLGFGLVWVLIRVIRSLVSGATHAR